MIVVVSGINKWWAVPIMPVLAGLKSFLAKYIGDPSSASLVK